MEHDAAPEASVIAEHDCPEAPDPTFRLTSLPAIGEAASPSEASAGSVRMAEREVGPALPTNASAETVSAVSSRVTSKSDVSALARCVASPAKLAANEEMPADSASVMAQEAKPVASVV